MLSIFDEITNENELWLMIDMYPRVHNKQISSDDIVIASTLSMSYENMLILVSSTTAYFEYHLIDRLIITINSDNVVKYYDTQ